MYTGLQSLKIRYSYESSQFRTIVSIKAILVRIVSLYFKHTVLSFHLH
jgi:hypothetical protein